MNDHHELRELLERVSKPGHDWLADSSGLLHEGRRRVRRRRLAGGAMASVVVLALGGVAVSPLAGFNSHKATPAATSYADLDLAPLSNAEVARRCLLVMKLDPGDLPTKDIVAPDSITHPNPGLKSDGHNVQTPKPWHTGTEVFVVPRTHKERVYYGGPPSCTIPEAGRVPQPFTRVGAVSQLRAECGDYAGIDLDGWQQLTASSDGTVADALFRSGNGYLAHCSVMGTAVGFTEVWGTVDVSREDAPRVVIDRHPPSTSVDGYAPSALCVQDTRGSVVHCVGHGRINDHSADQVDVTLPSGRVVRTNAVDGYWSVALRDDASGQWITHGAVRCGSSCGTYAPGGNFKAIPTR
jgi:hypothetical protein